MNSVHVVSEEERLKESMINATFNYINAIRIPWIEKMYKEINGLVLDDTRYYL